MKIGCTTYPFMELPGGMKKPAAASAGDPLKTIDASAPGFLLSRAALKYLQTIEQITSEIMNMTGNTAGIGADRSVEQVPAASPPEPVTTGDDVLVFFPPSAAPEGGGENPAELIAVKGMEHGPAPDAAEGKRGERMVALAGEIAEKLRRDAMPLGTGSVNQKLPEVREKFIVSVDTADGAPVPSIIRHDSSGETSEFHDLGGSDDMAVPMEVARVAVFPADLDKNPSPDGLPDDASLFREKTPSADEADDRGRSIAETAYPGGASFPESLVAAAREIGRTVSRLFFDNKSDREEGRGNGIQDHAADVPDGSAGSQAPVAGFPRVVVTLMEPAAEAGPNQCILVKANDIAARMAALTETINGFSAEPIPDMEDAAGDEATAAAAAHLPVREAMKQAAAASFAGALKSAFNMDGLDTAKTFGMTLDEKGFLTVDKTALRDSLFGSKSETLRFVHDFASSLHDRISHNAYAFAGVYAGVDEAVLDAARGKDRAEGDDADRKVEFEKRLNELQMLLKSSYELKDSFMQRKLAGQGWLK